jgi:membrane protein implicated in regulation of membrane protease activity
VVERTRAELDEMLKHLVLIGFGALIGWTGATLYGMASQWEIATNDALRFLLAILVVTFARRTYDEVQSWRASKRSTDERLGFATPVWETPRSTEMPSEPDTLATEAPAPPQ